MVTALMEQDEDNGHRDPGSPDPLTNIFNILLYGLVGADPANWQRLAHLSPSCSLGSRLNRMTLSCRRQSRSRSRSRSRTPVAV